MRVTTRGRYALRAMIDLALHASEGPVPRRDLAARQELSADYLAQLFGKLQSAGLVEGVKGPGGGYRLSREPSRISAGDVLRAVEGPIAVVPCVLPECDSACQRVDACLTHPLWQGLSDVVAEYVDSISLADLSDQPRPLAEEE